MRLMICFIGVFIFGITVGVLLQEATAILEKP